MRRDEASHDEKAAHWAKWGREGYNEVTAADRADYQAQARRQFLEIVDAARAHSERKSGENRRAYGSKRRGC